jgi:hypothetical protein
VRALGPATRRNSSYTLPNSSGTWNFVNATGTLHLKGVLRIALGKHSVKINSVTFTRRAKGNGQLTVKLAGHRVKLFAITGRVRIKRGATSETISGLTAKLTKAGAARVDKALHAHAFSAGQKLGSFTVTVTTSPISGSASGTSGAPGAAGASRAPGMAGTNGSGAGVEFIPAFRSLLDSAGLSAVPLVPASNGLPAPLGTTKIPGGTAPPSPSPWAPTGRPRSASTTASSPGRSR